MNHWKSALLPSEVRSGAHRGCFPPHAGAARSQLLHATVYPEQRGVIENLRLGVGWAVWLQDLLLMQVGPFGKRKHAAGLSLSEFPDMPEAVSFCIAPYTLSCGAA